MNLIVDPTLTERIEVIWAMTKISEAEQNFNFNSIAKILQPHPEQ
jgi:hypothetical protein